MNIYDEIKNRLTNQDVASGEHGSDMIEFIRQLKGFTHLHEAAQELIETFNLGIEAPCNSRNLKQKKINVKANEIVFSKGNTTSIFS